MKTYGPVRSNRKSKAGNTAGRIDAMPNLGRVKETELEIRIQRANSSWRVRTTQDGAVITTLKWYRLKASNDIHHSNLERE